MAHFETTHTAPDGEELYLQAWVPDDFKAAVLIVHGLAEHSGRYAHVADHLNEIHGFYNIPNREFLYTLSTFIYDVWEFINKYGWRKLTRHEELAIYHVYCTMGDLMKIKEIPPSTLLEGVIDRS